MNQIERLIDILDRNGIKCTAEKAEKLYKYYEMLVEKNKVMNLTAITEFDEVSVKHFADSLSIGRIKDISGLKVIDVGTGAGFPGIPLKIFYPDIKLTLLDSLNKRLMFLNDVIRELGLTDVETVHARAEEGAGKQEYREQFDVVVSRAVANLSTLVEYCLPFAKIGGCFVSYKGSKASEEINAAEKAIKILGGGNLKRVDFSLEGTDERSLILIEKLQTTPKKYPRPGGKPSSAPLS